MILGAAHIAGILFVLALIIGIGIYSGKKVKNAADFTTGGGKEGASLVAGTIVGALVSGHATLGTAQLAYSFGVSAWWFALGSGIGCFILAVGYSNSLRRSRSKTLVGIITSEYGSKSGYLASTLSSIGIFISVISQMLASTALLTTIFPLSLPAASVIAMALMLFYVVFGGAWGAGLGGIVKFVLLYIASVFGGAVVLRAAGGLSGLVGTLDSLLVGTALGQVNSIVTASDLSARFGSLVARGPLKDLGSGLSLILGVLSTQTYASAIWSAKSDKAAKKGALISAFMIPPIGIACILIGLFMRGHCITESEIAALAAAGQAVPEGLIRISITAQVFPAFVLAYLPKLFGGVVLGTLLITIVGGGAGLSLGTATILINDLACRLTDRLDNPQTKLKATRVTVAAVLVVSALIAITVPKAIINDLGYLSMGLRGAVIFVPLTAALHWQGKVAPKFVTAAIIVGPIAVIIGSMMNLPFDPLFIGMFAAAALCVIGRIAGNKA